MIALLLDHLWQSSLFAGRGRPACAGAAPQRRQRPVLAVVRGVGEIPGALRGPDSAGRLCPDAAAPPLSAPPLCVMEPLAQAFLRRRSVLVMTNLRQPLRQPRPSHRATAAFRSVVRCCWPCWAAGLSGHFRSRWIVRWSRVRMLLRDAVAIAGRRADCREILGLAA